MGHPWPADSDEAVWAGDWLTPEEYFFPLWDIVGDLEHHANTIHESRQHVFKVLVMLFVFDECE